MSVLGCNRLCCICHNICYYSYFRNRVQCICTLCARDMLKRNVKYVPMMALCDLYIDDSYVKIDVHRRDSRLSIYYETITANNYYIITLYNLHDIYMDIPKYKKICTAMLVDFMKISPEKYDIVFCFWD